MRPITKIFTAILLAAGAANVGTRLGAFSGKTIYEEFPGYDTPQGLAIANYERTAQKMGPQWRKQHPIVPGTGGPR